MPPRPIPSSTSQSGPPASEKTRSCEYRERQMRTRPLRSRRTSCAGEIRRFSTGWRRPDTTGTFPAWCFHLHTHGLVRELDLHIKRQALRHRRRTEKAGFQFTADEVLTRTRHMHVLLVARHPNLPSVLEQIHLFVVHAASRRMRSTWSIRAPIQCMTGTAIEFPMAL